MNQELAIIEAAPVTTVDSERHLSASTLDRMERSIPTETRRAYERQWRAFATWCAEQGRSALPATPETLTEYVNSLADAGRAPSTIEQAMATVRRVHRDSGYAGTPDTEDARKVLKTYKRDRAVAGKRKRQAPAITVSPLRTMVDALDVRLLDGLRDRALLVLGYAGMLRRSELAALNIADLRFTDDGLIVTVRQSKTDQEAAGEDVHIPYGSYASTCPVRTVRAWVDALAERGVTDGPLLRSLRRGGHLDASGAGMSGTAINRRVRELAQRAGVPDADRMTAHGLRAGAPTDASAAGKSETRIKAQGRWKSTAYQQYIRPADAWRDNPLSGLL